MVAIDIYLVVWVLKGEQNMDTTLFITRLIAILYVAIWLVVIAVSVYIIILMIKALRKYVNSKDVRDQKQVVKKSLGTVLKENRLRCKMTQEFVSETLGVSRQAVSKWENGTTDPSTSNLLALAQLYGIAADELLKSVSSDIIQEQDAKSTKGDI